MNKKNKNDIFETDSIKFDFDKDMFDKAYYDYLYFDWIPVEISSIIFVIGLELSKSKNSSYSSLGIGIIASIVVTLLTTIKDFLDEHNERQKIVNATCECLLKMYRDVLLCDIHKISIQHYTSINEHVRLVLNNKKLSKSINNLNIKSLSSTTKKDFNTLITLFNNPKFYKSFTIDETTLFQVFIRQYNDTLNGINYKSIEIVRAYYDIIENVNAFSEYTKFCYRTNKEEAIKCNKKMKSNRYIKNIIFILVKSIIPIFVVKYLLSYFNLI